MKPSLHFADTIWKPYRRTTHAGIEKSPFIHGFSFLCVLNGRPDHDRHIGNKPAFGRMDGRVCDGVRRHGGSDNEVLLRPMSPLYTGGPTAEVHVFLEYS
jgi:hypothetical protein